MSSTNANINTNKRARWAAVLQLFCIPVKSADQKTIQDAEPKTADITIGLSDEKPAPVEDEKVVATIIHEEPKSQPRPSTAPGAMCHPQPQPTAKIGVPRRHNSLMSKFSGRPAKATLEQEPISEVAPFLLYTPPVVPKRCHRRWSSASMAPQDVKNRLRTNTVTEDDAADTAVIKIGLLTEGPAAKPCSLDRVASAPTPPTKPHTHIYSCLRSSTRSNFRNSTRNSTSSRPHTPPFSKPKMENIPLPPPLPPTLKTTPCQRQSLSHVSQWVLFKVDDTHLHADTNYTHPMTVQTAISECFTKSPHYNASTTTVNTLGMDDGRGIMSSWSAYGKETGDEDEHHKRRTFILESKACAPLSGIAPAA